MRLKFLADAFVNGEIVYAKGSEVFVDNKLGSADRWIRRGIAVEIAEPEPKAVEKEEKKEEKFEDSGIFDSPLKDEEESSKKKKGKK